MLNNRIFSILNAVLLLLNSVLVGYLVISHQQTSRELALANERVLGASVPIFDRNMILTNDEFRSTAIFGSIASVQNYLTARNSPLANYTEGGRTAAEIIFGSARGELSSQFGIVPQLNPGLLMMKLQKESSLVWATGYDTVNDPQFRLKYAMGYACPDPAPGEQVQCDPRYVGFTNQVRMAAYQLEFNFQMATSSQFPDQYKVGNTIRTLDGYNVFLSNAATAALYRYTPHVYWGNYNQFKLMAISGWLSNGVSYTAAEIDAANLPSKNADSTVIVGEVQYEEIADLLIQPPVLGAQNERISKLQAFLKSQGFFSHPSITGFFGAVTQAAVDAYKTSEKYTANMTCDALKTVQWAQGMSGPAVTKLQECLIEAKLFNFAGGATGYLGPVTMQALEAWRKANPTPVQQPQQPVAPTPATPTPAPQPMRCEQLKSRSWRIGDTGSEVRELQQCLKDEGRFNWPAGITGFFGTYTQSILQSNTNSPTTPPSQNRCETLKTRSWTIGQTGQDVRDLQQCLKDEGRFNWPGGITGFFGSYTQSLLAPAAQTGVCTAQVNAARNWSIGRVGQDVRELQQCLQNAGIYRWQFGVTGFFGSYTKSILP